MRNQKERSENNERETSIGGGEAIKRVRAEKRKLGTQNGKAGNYKVKIGENAQENEE